MPLLARKIHSIEVLAAALRGLYFASRRRIGWIVLGLEGGQALVLPSRLRNDYLGLRHMAQGTTEEG